MCSDCQHWKRREAYEEGGLTFAPCALRPDIWVKDSRVREGRVRQEYATQSTYTCERFQQVIMPERVAPAAAPVRGCSGE